MKIMDFPLNAFSFPSLFDNIRGFVQMAGLNMYFLSFSSFPSPIHIPLYLYSPPIHPLYILSSYLFCICIFSSYPSSIYTLLLSILYMHILLLSILCIYSPLIHHSKHIRLLFFISIALCEFFLSYNSVLILKHPYSKVSRFLYLLVYSQTFMSLINTFYVERVKEKRIY